MARKKRQSQHKRANSRKDNVSPHYNLSQFMVENRIIDLYDKQEESSSEKDRARTLQTDFTEKALQKALLSLEKQHILKRSEEGWQRDFSSSHSPLIYGKLTVNPKGFGFVALPRTPGKRAKENEPFIPKEELNGAIHGDTVLVRPLPAHLQRGKRPSYVVIRITKPAPDILCGILREKRGSFLVSPDDSYIPFKVAIKDTELLNAKPGDAVQVQFLRKGESSRLKPGKILAVLGSPTQTSTQLKLAIEKFSLPTTFSAAALEQAKKMKMQEQGKLPRKDLCNTCHITIDGASAKDFDDAIAIEQLDNSGFRLYVSIADVSHFVTPDSALDKEAYQRGTSVYLPGKVIPMLPEELSNNLCSLLPNQKRYTFTAQLDFDSKANLCRQQFYHSVICSRQRFTYDTVWKILSGDAPLTEQYRQFVPMLKKAEKLAALLRKKRMQRGAIDFSLREPVFTLDEKGEVTSIKPAQRNTAHRLIEEFMLIANEATADFLTKKLTQPIFRIHQPPGKEKIAEFRKLAERLGISLQRYEKSPAWFSQVLQRAQGSQYEYLINTLLLRSLTQAQYATEQSGHFGLASPAYTHFTSPIRRYPDLMVHRMLTAVLQAEGKKSRKQKFAPEKTKDAALFLSRQERTAVEAERDVNDRLKISYMKNRIGDLFSAVISGVTENTLFVELEDPMVSGAIPVDLLGNDYFFHDPDHFRLVGEISRKEYQLGDLIEVELASISTSRRQLTFIPAQNQL